MQAFCWRAKKNEDDDGDGDGGEGVWGVGVMVCGGFDDADCVSCMRMLLMLYDAVVDIHWGPDPKT